jgi:hypothetical protein
MENESPESAPVPTPAKRGRKPLPEGMARDVPHVVNLRASESARAKAWAAAQGKPLGECIRGLLLPLIGACLLVLAGCGSSPSFSSVRTAACRVAVPVCQAVDAACSGAGPSAGGETASE